MHACMHDEAPKSGVQGFSRTYTRLPPEEELPAIIAACRKEGRLPMWAFGVLMYQENVPEHEQWEPIVKYVAPERGRFYGWRRITAS